MVETQSRTLGNSGIDVGALGFGCWAIGGEWRRPDRAPRGGGALHHDQSRAPVPGARRKGHNV
ncbi:hypothetical protein ACFXP3_03750, partial [Streptomyces sp. NPDC059096]